MARILIIDDDADALYALREILEDAGYEVIEALDGTIGLRVLRQQRPQLVITDIFMPEQDGLETISALKQEFPMVKTIAISGGGQQGDLSYLAVAKAFGADEVFSKPIDRQTLLDAIQQLLKISEFSD
jgi:CheY-like chemotaxis protein